MKSFGNTYKNHLYERSQTWRVRAHALRKSGNLPGFHAALKVARMLAESIRIAE